jgi:hypothetical protein
MEPNRIGRVLGVGTRVAANMLRQQAQAAASASQAAASASKTGLPASSANQGNRSGSVAKAVSGIAGAQNLRTTGQKVARGARGFGRSLWNPFAHATTVLWLEITGLFFGLFTLYFISNGWKFHHDSLSGPDHRKFLLYASCAMVFFYFTVSSFARARRKGRLQHRQAK